MLTNYLLAAWRRLSKQKGFFALNFIGLYVSVTACLLIALLIIFECSFDKNTTRPGLSVYRIVSNAPNNNSQNTNAHTPYPVATGLRTAMPDIKDICEIHFDNEAAVLVGNDVMKEKGILFADSVYPRMFPMQTLAGSLHNAFSAPGTVTLTESTAKRYFHTTDPLGKHIKLGGSIDLAVVAVVKDPAPNSHLPFHLIASLPSLTPEFIGGMPLDQWTVTGNGFTYIGFDENSAGNQHGSRPENSTSHNQIARTEHILADLLEKNVHSKDPKNDGRFALQAVSSIHNDTLYAATNAGDTVNNSYLALLGAIAFFLILAAAINYTNLSTAMALKKGREVGVRKVLGASRGQLIRMMLTETSLLTGIVILAAAGSVSFFLPELNKFLEKNIPLQWVSPIAIAFLIGLWVLVALLSGIYPAIVLSSFQPVKALKSMTATPKTSIVFLRRALVVFQFVTAQILVICAIVVAKQMVFVQNSPLGFHKDLILDLDLPNPNADQARAFRSRLSAVPGIDDISFSVGAPVSHNHIGTDFNLREQYKTHPLQVHVKAADKDYRQVYGLEMLAGRWFSEQDERACAKTVPDSLKHYTIVLSETAARTLGFRTPEQALGKEVTFGLNMITGPVIGVVKDFHHQSMREAMTPILLTPFAPFYYNAGIRLTGLNTATLASIEKAYKDVYPQQLYDANFLDQTVAAQYKEEKRTQQIFNIATALSISINILGLIGLLAFTIQQKTREVGIRKVLGATAGQISFLLSRDFLRLIGISFLIAAPIAGIIMHHWLQDYANRTGLSWWIFAAALSGTALVTALAIGFQTLKAASLNPVKSLRSE